MFFMHNDVISFITKLLRDINFEITVHCVLMIISRTISRSCRFIPLTSVHIRNFITWNTIFNRIELWVCLQGTYSYNGLGRMNGAGP